MIIIRFAMVILTFTIHYVIALASAHLYVCQSLAEKDEVF